MSQITFTKDILEEVAKENGWHVEQVKYVYDLIVQCIHDGAKTSSVMYIPHIGNLYLKTSQVKHKMEISDEIRGYYEDRVKQVDKEFEEFKSEERNKKKRWLHTNRSVFLSPKIRMGMSTEELEKFQNET